VEQFVPFGAQSEKIVSVTIFILNYSLPQKHLLRPAGGFRKRAQTQWRISARRIPANTPVATHYIRDGKPMWEFQAGKAWVKSKIVPS
jgi:hypothetical protein